MSQSAITWCSPRLDRHSTRTRTCFHNICAHNKTRSCLSSTSMNEVYNRDFGKMSYKPHRYQKLEKRFCLFQIYFARGFTWWRSKTQVPNRKNVSRTALLKRKWRQETLWKDVILSKAAKKARRSKRNYKVGKSEDTVVKISLENCNNFELKLPMRRLWRSLFFVSWREKTSSRGYWGA